MHNGLAQALSRHLSPKLRDRGCVVGRERAAVLPNTTRCPTRVYVLDVPMGRGDTTPLHENAESKGAKQEKGFGGGSGAVATSVKNAERSEIS